MLKELTDNQAFLDDEKSSERMEFEEAFKEGFRKGFIEGFKEGFREGFREGVRKGQIEIVKRMFKANMSFEDVILFTELSESEITDIKNEMAHEQP
jgi:predicted transposase/invertase (TIGR01784 family)